jgi:glycosyltransferase involved in cell wall biosynthesis
MSTPLVSIVTPSYNQAAFLEQTILSVLDQDYSAIEYIVVDGASTDGSPEIIQRYAERLGWWVSEPDSGQAEAINKGIKRSQGEIIAWLNSDDLYFPGIVSGAVAALQADLRLGMVFGDGITMDVERRPLNRLTFGDWGLKELMGFRIICQPAVFMRREILEMAGWGPEKSALDPSYHFMLDHHLWLRMAKTAPIRHIPAPWAAARYHPAAKNVAQAAGFASETQRLLGWMRLQPDLAPLITANRKMVEAGAQRLIARYLLDGRQPGPALQAYGKAFLLDPAYTLKHWHRIIYALLSLVGGKSLGNAYYGLRRRRQPDLKGIPELKIQPQSKRTKNEG